MQDLHYESNDLGLTYGGNACRFKVWAPTASQVEVVLYEDAGEYDQYGMVHNHEGGLAFLMNPRKKGTWSLELEGDHTGKYYMYRVSFSDGTVNYAVDPYAKAVAAGGARTAIIDMKKTNPKDWEDDVRPPQIRPTDAIIYELHVRDFSINGGNLFQQKGLYRAFTEEGLTDQDGNLVGIDHLVELGITHVHLMPVFDFKTVNELTVHDPSVADGKYNWGYDPQNFNVPEGSYSSDPTNPAARIIEFKQMVQALHRKGIRVIMDVVYNHTFGVDDGPFEGIVPGYFYRTNSEGYLTNGSGVGNELATERPMVRKYIKDSVRYWAEEYHIDGFRFDLMGLIDTRTMTEITNMLQQEIDRTILVYGEPWTGGDSPLWDKTLKGAQKGKGFAVFNDNYRSAVKGDNDGYASGFATGWWGVEGAVLKGVQGAIHDFTYHPSETINYVTAHDNLNLWDKIVTSLGMRHALSFPEWHNGSPSGGYTAQEAVTSADPYRFVEPDNMLSNDTVRRSLLANGIMITSQGIPFLHAGDEILRSKYGDHNSYRSGDAVNALRWSNKARFRPVFDYYCGLLRLRKEHVAFKMAHREQVERHLKVLSCGHGVVAYLLEGTEVKDSWNQILIIYNGKEQESRVDLPQDCVWNVVVNDRAAGVEVLDHVQGNVTVPRLSMMVLYDKESGVEPQILTSMDIRSPKKAIQCAEEMKLEVVFKDQHDKRIEGLQPQWRSSDPEKIIVRQTGKIIGTALGEGIITAVCGEVEASIRIIVDHLVPARIEVTGESMMYATRHYPIQTTVRDQYNQVLPGQTVQLATTTPRIVSIDHSGKLLAIRPGKGVILVHCGSLTAEWNVQIHPFSIRTVEIEYERPDHHYDGWNVWVWGTGIHDGKIPFHPTSDGSVVAKVKVAPGMKRIGYIIRLNEWERREGDRDLFIEIPSTSGNERIKVKVKSGTREIMVAVGGRLMKLNGLSSA